MRRSWLAYCSFSPPKEKPGPLGFLGSFFGSSLLFYGKVFVLGELVAMYAIQIPILKWKINEIGLTIYLEK